MAVIEVMAVTEVMEVTEAMEVTVVTEEAEDTTTVDMAEGIRVIAVTVAMAVNEMTITTKEQETQ